MLMYVSVPVLLTYFHFTRPASGISLPLLVVFYLLICATLIGLNYARKASPHMIYGVYNYFIQLLRHQKILKDYTNGYAYIKEFAHAVMYQ